MCIHIKWDGYCIVHVQCTHGKRWFGTTVWIDSFLEIQLPDQSEQTAAWKGNDKLDRLYRLHTFDDVQQC